MCYFENVMRAQAFSGLKANPLLEQRVWYQPDGILYYLAGAMPCTLWEWDQRGNEHKGLNEDLIMKLSAPWHKADNF